MIFDIDPYKAVGPLRFGMTKADAERAIGNVDRIRDSPDGVVELYCFSLDILAQISKDEDKLFEIGFGRRSLDVTLGSIDFFKTPQAQVLAALCKLDSTAVSQAGTIVFPKLGISLVGFQDDDGDDTDKSMTVFAEHVWDDLLPSMTPFSC